MSSTLTIPVRWFVDDMSAALHQLAHTTDDTDEGPRRGCSIADLSKLRPAFADGGTATAYAWLVWMHGQTRRPPFWIPPDCEERLTRADDAARFTTHPVTPRPASDGLDLPEYLRRTPPRPRS